MNAKLYFHFTTCICLYSHKIPKYVFNNQRVSKYLYKCSRHVENGKALLFEVDLIKAKLQHTYIMYP